MKIVIFGLTISSSWGNGHATVWRSLCRALAARDHQVVFFEHDVPYYASHRDFKRLPGIELILYSDWPEAARRAKQHLAEADVAIVTSYCFDAVQACDLVVSSRARLRAFYDMDGPVTLDQLRQGKQVEYLPEGGLGAFDLVLSFTGGRTLEELRCRLGAKRVAALYGSVDPDLHRRVPAVDSYRADLSYLGTYAADRQPALCELFIQPARQLPERRFCIGGAQYPSEFPWTENIFFVRHLPPSEHAAFYCSSRLTLNITRQAMAAMGCCPSGRLFEASACGTPIITDVWEGLEKFFEPGREIILARSIQDTLAALDLSDNELARIAGQARQRTLDQHSAGPRARQFEQIVTWALGKNQQTQLDLH